MEQKDLTKSLILNFYTNILGKNDTELAHQIIDENYIQHNPNVKNGRAGLLEALAFLKQMPKPQNPPKPNLTIISDCDFGAGFLIIEVMGIKKAVFDVFRIATGLIAEHWDAIQDISEGTSLRESSFKKEIVGNDSTEQNKTIIEEYLQKVFIEKDVSIHTDFISSNSVFHNAEDLDFDSFYKAVQIENLHRILGDENLVVTQSNGLVHTKPAVFYNMFRLENKKIEEHLCVYQTIPKTMAHSNGMI